MLEIGHHIVVDRHGISHVFRPIETMGNHTPGHNHESLSVCLVGGIDEKGVPCENFTNAQFDTAAYLLAMAVKEWPEVTPVSRYLLQRRKGDPETPPITEEFVSRLQHYANETFGDTASPITKVIWHKASQEKHLCAIPTSP